MPPQLHHVVMRSHSAPTFVAFLTDVVGMEVQFELHVPGEVLEKTWAGHHPTVRMSPLSAQVRQASSKC